MGQDERLLQASSFGAAALAYAEHRPDYALAAVRWALEPAPGRRVLDLGAGTGKLTAALVALGAEVIAIEPDSAMLAELRRGLPRVRALRGHAESLPLPDESVDAVLAGNGLSGLPGSGGSAAAQPSDRVTRTAAGAPRRPKPTFRTTGRSPGSAPPAASAPSRC